MTSRRLKKEFNKARQLCDAATIGKWTFIENNEHGPRHATHTLYGDCQPGKHGLDLFGRLKIDWNGENNLAFICTARDVLPKALDQIDRQDKKIARLRKKLAKLKK